MSAIVVIENTRRWPLKLPNAEVVSAKNYLTEPSLVERRGARVYNLCRTYAYQALGYYVSLLAEARGHRPTPSVATLQDLRLVPLIRLFGEEQDRLIQRSLSRIKADRFTLSIYFGRNLASKYDRLSLALFSQFPAPLLRAQFVRGERWKLDGIRAIPTSEIGDTHHSFVMRRARQYFDRPIRKRKAAAPRYEMAILADLEATDAPSDERALGRFVRAAQRKGIRADVVDREEYPWIAEYDALFIRETTYVDHHTYRFSRRAAAAGLVVIDDPESIVRCTNKVFQAEMFARNGIATPRTIVVHEDNASDAVKRIGLPCVLKQPDSSFSQGVIKVSNKEDFSRELDRFLEKSHLAVVQEFTPSTFDWRIGVLDGRPLFACRYHMARGHWQIIKSGPGGVRRYGKVETVPLERVPRAATRLATTCARLFGDGLYGVDVKQVGRRFLVVEINDNPNIDAGVEDRVLGDRLYDAIINVFLNRLERKRSGGPK